MRLIISDLGPPANLRDFFLTGTPLKSYEKPRLGGSTLTQIGLDTPNLALINFFVLRTLKFYF